MNINTFRRGGLFDPITFDSGRSLAQGAGGFFGNLGNPVMKASNPADWEALADKKLSMGDMAGAEQAQERAKQLRAAYDQQAQVRQMQRAALNKMHGENDVLLAETLGQEKQAEIAKAQRQKAVEALSTRFGKENAEILVSLPPDKRGDIIKEMMKGRKTDIRTYSDENGNKWDWIVDSETGEQIKRIGLKEHSVNPADQKKRESEAKTANGKRTAYLDTHLTASNNVKTAISDAKELVDDTLAAGFGSGMARKVGGTSAKNLEAALNTIKANIGFDRLQQMREESKTGGALGQVAIMELIMLQSVISSLEQAQSDSQLKASLDRVEEHYNRLINAMESEKSELSGDEGWSIVGE